MRLTWRPLALAAAWQRARKGPLLMSVGVHVGVIAVLLVTVAPDTARTAPRALTLIDVSALPAPLPAAKPAPPPQPRPVKMARPLPVVVPPPEVPLPAPSPVVVAMLAQSMAQTAGGACDLSGPVQEALRSSAAVQAELPSMPRPSRSVANAIMVWDADWVTLTDVPPGAPHRQAHEIIRDTIAGVVAVASDECRAQPQAGPRLMVLPLGETETVVLALGSGQWNWQQLLDTARPDGWVLEDAAPNAQNSTLAGGTLASLSPR